MGIKTGTESSQVPKLESTRTETGPFRGTHNPGFDASFQITQFFGFVFLPPSLSHALSPSVSLHF